MTYVTKTCAAKFSARGTRLALASALAALALLIGLGDAGAQGLGEQQAGDSVIDPMDRGAAAPTSTVGTAQGAGDSDSTSGMSRDERRRAHQARRRAQQRKKRSSSRKRSSREVTATVDVAAGPSFFTFGNPFQNGEVLSGPVYEDQPIHYGIRFDAAAIIDYEFYRKNRDLVPRKYRGMFKPDTEIRYAPAAVALIPRNLYISPKTKNTGVYGATWELMAIGLTLLKSDSTKLSVGAGLLATYAYIDSDVFESTHFLRPGASLGLNIGTMFSETFGMSVGWDSNFYLPQDIGGGIMEGSGDDALWHIGEGFLMFHYRFPYTTTI
jgi:hypothetical protein